MVGETLSGSAKAAGQRPGAGSCQGRGNSFHRAATSGRVCLEEVQRDDLNFLRASYVSSNGGKSNGLAAVNEAVQTHSRGVMRVENLKLKTMPCASKCGECRGVARRYRSHLELRFINH